MKGTAYMVGVGPGEPELMTLKAVRVIRECGCVAVPGREPACSTAYRIAAQVIPGLEQKRLIALSMPMTRDREEVRTAHCAAADRIKELLDAGEDVACLTLGDPTVYSTTGYLQRILIADGYRTETVSGVPSFCAAAARLRIPLCEWNQPLRLLPSVHAEPIAFDEGGNYVLMKPAGRIAGLKEQLTASGKNVMAVENCGMEGERVFLSADELPEDAGYFTVLIVREES